MSARVTAVHAIMAVLCSLLIVMMALPMYNVEADTASELRPGVKFLLAQSGLDLLTDRLVDLVVLNLLSTPIDDVKGVVKVALVGDVEYAMTDITITSAEIKGFEAVLQAPNVVSVQQESISIGLSLNWAYKQVKFPHAKGSGDATGLAKEAVIHCQIAVSTVDNKPHLKVVADEVDLGDMDIKIRGGTAGWVLDLLKGLFKKQIREAANKAISSAIREAIDVKFNELMAGTSFVFPLAHTGLSVDAHIAGDIVVTDRGFISIGSKAEVVDSRDPKESPYVPAELPADMIVPHTKFNLYISEYPALTAGFATLSAGLFEQTITPDMIPSGSPIQLNTASLRPTLPDLYREFPDRDIVLKTHVQNPPLGRVTPGGMAAMMNGTVSFFVVKDDDSLHQVLDFSFGVSPVVDKFAVVSDKGGRVLNITGNVARFGADVRLLKSYIGDTDATKFINTIKLLVNTALLSHVNKLLGPGYPVELPKGVIVTDAAVKLEDGFVAIAGNVDYLPPEKTASEKHDELFIAILKKIDRYNSRMVALQKMAQNLSSGQ